MNSNEVIKCRLCLESTDNNQMFELFPEQKDVDLKLYEKIEYCCGVRIRQSPEMPSKICLKCFDMTRIWFNFRQMCVNSQVYLESLCKDRKRPEEFDDENYDESAYLDYLLQELQTSRVDTTRIKIEDALTESIDYADEDEDQYEEVFFDEIESDTEFDEILNNIKSAKDCDSEIDVLEIEADEETKPRIAMNTKMQRGKGNTTMATKEAKKLKPISKKALRPPSPNSYMCSVCGNVYTKKASFTFHMSLHSNVRPHECELCGKAFRQVCELKNHMRRHTGEKPYKCTYCERRFIDRSEKHRHERVHTNSRPYVCNVCGKSFAYSTILKNHLKLHSGEKDYNCLVCNKSFSLQHQLKAHLQTLTHKQKETQFVADGYEVVYE